MITYMVIKEEYLDFDEVDSYIMLPLCVLLDVIFTFFQPIFYIIYKKKKMDDE